MTVLQVIKGDTPEQILELHGERTVFGRHPNCEVVLDNAAVSRHHAQILENHGSFFLEDLRSRNGTLLNGTPVKGRARLSADDEIEVCDFVFRFCEKVPNLDSTLRGAKAKPSTATKSKKNAASPPIDKVIRTTMAIDGDSILDDSHFSADEHIFAVGDDIEHYDGVDGDLSSIVSRLDMGSSTSTRLALQPEAKLRAFVELSKSIGHTLDEKEISQKVLDGLFKIFPQADEGFTLLKTTGKNRLHMSASKLRHGNDDEHTVPVSMTIVRHAMRTSEALLSANASNDQRFQTSESVSNMRIHSLMCAPLVGNNEEVHGVVQLTTRNIVTPFDQDDLDLLSSLIFQASLALDNSNMHQAALEKHDLERDLEFATQVQLGFLPNERPSIPGYDFFDFYEAAQSVGGDYFDYIPLSNGRIAVAIGDVAGKGVPAALQMARLYSSARFHLMTNKSPGDALAGLNKEIASSALGHRFITFVVAIIDPKKHQFTLANAGHMAPICRDKNNNVKGLAHKQAGMPLGIVDEQKFETVSFPFHPGDTILFFTDGITEAPNPKNEIYGTERLSNFLKSAPSSCEDVVKEVVADAERFAAGRTQRDDMCVVCVQRTLEGAKSSSKK